MTLKDGRNHAAGAKAKIRIFLVDDHPIVLTGLRLLINQEDDMEVCGEAGASSEALSAALRLKPDVAVLDISLEGASGIELLHQIHQQLPETWVLMLSMHDESLYAERAIRAGARGYVMKQLPPQTVLAALRTVASGEPYFSDRMKAQMIKGLLDGSGASAGKSGVERLSGRELEIFQLIGAGCTVRDIAGRLNLSAKTVETHRDHIRQKLDLRNSADVVHRAIRWVTSEAAAAAPLPDVEKPEV